MGAGLVNSWAAMKLRLIPHNSSSPPTLLPDEKSSSRARSSLQPKDRIVCM
jgi:hypothetical protein